MAAGEDRVLGDPAFAVQLLPALGREEEVGGAVAVQVADLAAAELEGELAALAGAGLDPVPARDLGGDPSRARCGVVVLLDDVVDLLWGFERPYKFKLA